MEKGNEMQDDMRSAKIAAELLSSIERSVALVERRMRGEDKGLFDQRNVALAVTHGEDMIHRFREAIRIGGLDSGPPDSIVAPPAHLTEEGAENTGSMPVPSYARVDVIGEEGEWIGPQQAGSLIWSREHANPIMRWRITRMQRDLSTFDNTPKEPTAAEAAKVEPVAWLYEMNGFKYCYSDRREPSSEMRELGWTETPLIPAPKGQSDA